MLGLLQLSVTQHWQASMVLTWVNFGALNPRLPSASPDRICSPPNNKWRLMQLFSQRPRYHTASRAVSRPNPGILCAAECNPIPLYMSSSSIWEARGSQYQHDSASSRRLLPAALVQRKLSHRVPHHEYERIRARANHMSMQIEPLSA